MPRRWTWLAPVLALACSRTTTGGDARPAVAHPGPTPSATSSATAGAATSFVSGTVAGQPLAVRSAVFLWRDKADDMQLVLADTDGLCQALREGGWPLGATLLYLSLKHNGRDNRNAPFTAGDYPVRSGAALPQDTKKASFMKLDEQCTPVTSGQATAGVVHLSTKEVNDKAALEGSFELTIGAADTLEGRFTATYCPPPEMEPHGCPAAARPRIE